MTRAEPSGSEADRELRRSTVIIGVNSALAFASAYLITVVIHEVAHGLVAQALGFSPKVYPFVEDNPRGTTLQDILIAAGGPLGSLVTGLLFAWLYVRGRDGYSFWRLFLCWLAFLGVIEFVNYLIVTPWLVGGDTAVIADRLGWSTLPRYVVAALGVVALFALSAPATRMMYAAAPRGTQSETARDRRRYITATFYLPAFAALALVALASIGSKPLYVFYGLLAAFGSTDIVGVALGATRRPAGAQSGTNERRRATVDRIRVEPLGVALYVALLLFYVVALVRGVPV